MRGNWVNTCFLLLLATTRGDEEGDDYIRPNVECDLTRFEAWRDVGGAWSNGTKLETYFRLCSMALKQLEIDLAGRHGPVTSLAMYDVMCSYECLESDKLHEEAMRISDCNCEEVSTQPSSNYFKIRGDFCRENSGRQL